MAKSLNLNNTKKQFFTVTLPDEANTVLLITTPTKTTLEEFIGVKNTLSNPNELEEDALDVMYDLVAKVMSHNKGKVKVTREMLSDCMDFEDMFIFINAYTDFIQGIVNQKN